MHKINRALMPTEEHENAFQRLCNSHIEELRAHKHREKMVEKTKKLKDGDPNKWAMCPPPSAHPDVINAIIEDGDDYNIQYELFDDAPIIAPKTLDDKKNDLTHELIAAAHAANEKIYPARKMMLLEMDVSDIYKSISDKLQALPQDKRTNEVHESIKKSLPKDQRDKIAKFDETQDRRKKVSRHLAEQQAELHDLTDKDIDTWKYQPFPEA